MPGGGAPGTLGRAAWSGIVYGSVSQESDATHGHSPPLSASLAFVVLAGLEGQGPGRCLALRPAAGVRLAIADSAHLPRVRSCLSMSDSSLCLRLAARYPLRESARLSEAPPPNAGCCSAAVRVPASVPSIRRAPSRFARGVNTWGTTLRVPTSIQPHTMMLEAFRYRPGGPDLPRSGSTCDRS